jgi:hypothetical protein
MKTFFLPLVLVAMVTSQNQLLALFSQCAAKMGKDYQTARDGFLEAKPTKEFLQGKMQAPLGRERLTARILLGWLDNAKDYRELLAAPKIKNQLGDDRYPWMVEVTNLSPKVGPLLLEILYKDTQPANVAWDATEAYISLLARGLPVDVPALHEVIRDDKNTSALVRTRIAWILRFLPQQKLQPEEFLASLQAELKHQDKSPKVAQTLLEGLAASVEGLPIPQKEKIVNVLLQEKTLPDFLGEVHFVHAIGELGGGTSAKLVANYLKKTEASVEKHWALEALSKSGSEVATPEVLKFAQATEIPSLQAMAIRGLGDLPFQEDIGNVLAKIITDNKGLEANRIRALKSFDTLHLRNFDNKKADAAIAAHLEKIAKMDLQSAAVSRHLNRTLESVVERRKK